MDNKQFNVNGKTQGELAAIFEFIFRHEFGWPSRVQRIEEGYGGFTGYLLDPHLGLVLRQYPINGGAPTLKFPFNEGYDPQQLASFVYQYLNSTEAKKVTVPPIPPPVNGDPGYDPYAHYRAAFRWDIHVDHDGSNGTGWRIYTGDWGHIQPYGHSFPYAIRPIITWHGK